MEAPQNPAGIFVPEEGYNLQRRAEFVVSLTKRRRCAKRWRASPQNNLETRYRNWRVRQIVHHLADSHVNSYIRFLWALTEEQPTIKPYDDGKWAALEDSRWRSSSTICPLGGAARMLLRAIQSSNSRGAFSTPRPANR